MLHVNCVTKTHQDVNLYQVTESAVKKQLARHVRRPRITYWNSVAPDQYAHPLPILKAYKWTLQLLVRLRGRSQSDIMKKHISQIKRQGRMNNCSVKPVAAYIRIYMR